MVTMLLSDFSLDVYSVLAAAGLRAPSGVSTKMAYHVDSVLGGSGNRVSE
jgi:hypothetical protein